MSARWTTSSTLFAVLVLLSSAVLALPQRKGVRTPPGSSAQKPKPAQYSDKAFDPSVTTLPVGFRGHNLIGIYDRLAARQGAASKGEFETTEAYRQGTQAEADRPLFGGLDEKSIFAFAVSDLDSEYDADKQTFHVRAKLSRVSEGVALRDTGMALTWELVNNQRTSYVGTNAYGAQVKVERRTGDFHKIAFDNYQDLPIVRYLDKLAQRMADDKKKMYERLGVKQPTDEYDFMKETAFVVDLKMAPEMAMKAKPNLRLLVVCRLAAPYTIEGGTYTKPTMDRPDEYFFRNYALNTNLLELWLFDSATGQVYAKQKAGEQMTAVATPVKPSLELISWNIKPDEHVSGNTQILGDVVNASEETLDRLGAEMTCQLADGTRHDTYIVIMTRTLKPQQCAHFVGHLAGESTSCDVIFKRFDQRFRQVVVTHIKNLRQKTEAERTGCIRSPLDSP